MRRVRGVYDGAHVVLLDPIALQPNTAVEVLIPESTADPEQLCREKLRAAGLVTTARRRRPGPRRSPSPVHVKGEPLSRTIEGARG